MKITTALIIILFSLNAISQNNNGKIVYQSITTIDWESFGDKNLTNDKKEEILNQLKSVLEKTYILSYNSYESNYKQEEKISTGNNNSIFPIMGGGFSTGAKYINLKTKQILEESEFMGKQFLINDTITNYNWELINETKKIGDYTVHKATLVKEVNIDDEGTWMPNKKSNENDKVSLADKFVQPKEILITAWYTPQIPLSIGPDLYGGLPGLILEIQFNRTTIICSKVVLKNNNLNNIKKPTKGDLVSRKEYNILVKKKMEEFSKYLKN